MNHEHRIYTGITSDTEVNKFNAVIMKALVEINDVVLQALLKQELVREAVRETLGTFEPTVIISLQEDEQLCVVAEWATLEYSERTLLDNSEARDCEECCQDCMKGE